MSDVNIKPVEVKLKRLDRDERVLLRLELSDAHRRFQRKVYNLRRLVAGDFSDVLPSAPAATKQSDGANARQIDLREFYNFIVTDFDGKHSNRLLEAVKQTLMAVAFSKPDVEFEGLSSKLSMVNTQYVKQRLSEPPIGCGAVDEMHLAFLDFLIGGIGWSDVWLDRSAPCAGWADSLDMKWDRSASTFAKCRWQSRIYRESAAYWLGKFGRKAMGEDWQPQADNLDHIVEMEWYYDVDQGPNGSHYVFRREGDSVGNIVYQGDNPWYFMYAGQRLPYLPQTPLYYLALPSVTDPIGMVEMMLTDQIALWRIEDYKDHARTSGKPFYKIRKGKVDAEAKKRFNQGNYGEGIEVQQPDDISEQQGLQVPADIAGDQAYYDRRIVAKAGLNPYASGAPVEGIDFASEVKEISGMSNLTVGFASEDNAIFWTNTVRKLLAAGKLYDDRPMEVPIGDSVVLFDAFNPVKQYLRPTAELVISADKMAFRPRAQRIQEAIRDLEIAGKVAQQFPNAVNLAYEDYLRATGKKNITDFLKPPTAPPMVAGAGVDPAADPAAAALASTA
jgi:hypothetical protein